MLNSLPTLIIAECVLVYLHADQVDKMMKWNCSQFHNLSAVIYEMINPKDPFGEMMITNIEVKYLFSHEVVCSTDLRHIPA